MFGRSLVSRNLRAAGRRMMSGSPEEARAETFQWKKYSASECRSPEDLSPI
tara:strand:+ start:338 stop:490 length:153 start_codon:yes stop_codon:yes gene_type:complete